MADGGLTLVQFGAPWCGACRLTDPVIARIVASEVGVVLRKVDVAEAPAEAEAMRVSGLPTLVFLAPDGRELHRIGGGTLGSRRIATALEAARAAL